MVGPAKIDHEASPERAGGPARPCARVLYVEDDADNAQLVQVLLSGDQRIELITAPDGSTGLAAAGTSAPDLILLDLGLPDMTGAEFLRSLRDNPATVDIPIIVVTADADAGYSAPVRAARVRAYIVKPINIREFLSVVTHTLFPPVA